MGGGTEAGMIQRLVAYPRAILRFYTHFGAGFVGGAIYVAILLTVPPLLRLAAGLW